MFYLHYPIANKVIKSKYKHKFELELDLNPLIMMQNSQGLKYNQE